MIGQIAGARIDSAGQCCNPLTNWSERYFFANLNGNIEWLLNWINDIGGVNTNFYQYFWELSHEIRDNGAEPRDTQVSRNANPYGALQVRMY